MIQQEIFVQMTLRAWNIQLTRTTEFIASQTDADLQKQVAPGKNRLIYLVGHLIAVNDSMSTLFATGERLYTHLDEAFLKNPDRMDADMPDAITLRQDWENAKEVLTKQFTMLPAADWMAKHTAMTEEDFMNEPTRNKLSVLINRTNHMAYHLGQMMLAK